MEIFTIDQVSVNEDEWTIVGKLVNKWIYTHKDDGEISVLLTLLFIDAKGATIELKTWKPVKAYTVYRKVVIGETYRITGEGELLPPNPEYSTSDVECARNFWYVAEMDEELEQMKNFKHLTSIEKGRKFLNAKEPFNFLGIYLSHTKGTMKHRAVQGYYVNVVDETGNLFKILVWHSIRIEKNKFPLFNCQRGDTILIIGARLTKFSSKEQGPLLTLTTVVPPLINTDSISNRRQYDLKRRVKSKNGVFTEILGGDL